MFIEFENIPFIFFFTSVHLICARELKPNPTVSPLKPLAILVHHGLSALYTNTPPLRRFSNISAFACATPLNTLETFQVRFRDVNNYCNIRSANLRQASNFSRSICAHFQHTILMSIFYFKYCDRYTNEIIKAFCDFATEPKWDNK